MKILAIESSCDETSVAIVEDRTVLSNVIATQIDEHKIYGGGVPEIASRRHAEAIAQVCEELLCLLRGIGIDQPGFHLKHRIRNCLSRSYRQTVQPDPAP